MQNIIKSFAKINLSLNVTGKTSSLHKIESIISFVSLHDEILIKTINSDNVDLMINMGPQHPSTHGVLRLEVMTDGEIVSEIKPHLGYYIVALRNTLKMLHMNK